MPGLSESDVKEITKGLNIAAVKLALHADASKRAEAYLKEHGWRFDAVKRMAVAISGNGRSEEKNT